MKKLKPLQPNVRLENKLKREILQQIYSLIFSPILKTLETEDVHISINSLSSSEVVKALMDGRIVYQEDRFVGNFNARISRELKEAGATKEKTGWKLLQDKMSDRLRFAIISSQSKFFNISRKIDEQLSSIDLTRIFKDFIVRVTDQYFVDLNKIDRTISQNVKDIVTIVPEFSEKTKADIANEYANNLELYVADFSREEILKLRTLIQQNAFQGARANQLKQIIKKEFGISERKAAFLSKQESSLLLAQYSKSRYSEIGINKYQWSTSHDSRVRHDHAELNGKIFSFDRPPVVNRKTGARANPGEDYGCRCVAIPIVE